MTTPNPTQQTANDIRTLQFKVSTLQEQVRLIKARDAVEDVQTTLNSLAQRIASLRSRGYVFGKGLEDQAQALTDTWTQLHPNLQSEINTQSNLLMNALRPIEAQMPQLAAAANNLAIARNLLATLQPAISQLESKVSAAERAITGMYDQLNNQLSQLTRKLEEIESLLSNLSEASFQLLPTEGGIAAVKAVWCKSGKEQKSDPEGILFLTDQRILFERKETVTTKKALFITTEKQKFQELQLECPVALVEQVKTSKQGLMKNEDHIEVRFASGAPYQVAHFHIWRSCEEWQGLINRAKAKDFDKERAVAIDQAEVDKVKAAPSKCPSCGANISVVVMRGMESVKCEYCGHVMRL